jgi:tRNA-Thr(GGU) m(6)t(6)A37 methyltransferase TsaA
VIDLTSKSSKHSFQVFPIGYIRRNANNNIKIEVSERFKPALKQLDHFSHVMVFWWAHKHDNEKSRSTLSCEPPYAKGKITGVFATRAEYRPNPIAMTTCKILKVDEMKGIIEIADIDAYDGTPIVDLKAYFPICDRVKRAKIPEWLLD